MKRATFLASARTDLVEILTYVSERSGSISTGERFVRALRTKCHEWASIPGTIGRDRPELGMNIRALYNKNYVVFFRYSDDRFEVVAIIEGHRDIDAHLVADDDV